MQQQNVFQKKYTCTSIKYDDDGDQVEPHFGRWCDECGYGALAGYRFDCVGLDKDDTICEITLCYDCYLENEEIAK